MFRVWTADQSWFVNDEDGATVVEYVLLVALMAGVVIAGALFLGI